MYLQKWKQQQQPDPPAPSSSPYSLILYLSKQLSQQKPIITLVVVEMFAKFVNVYEQIMKLNTINEIVNHLKHVQKLQKLSSDEMNMWLYFLLSFNQKCRINDKHLLTIFCKIEEPHIDRLNLQNAFKRNGVSETCSQVIKCEYPNTLTLTEAFEFYNGLKILPTKCAVLIEHFKKVVYKCDRRSLKCLIDLVRTNCRNKKILCKKRNLYVFRQVFGRKNVDHVRYNIQMITNRSNDEPHCPGKPIDPMLAFPCKSMDKIIFNTACIETKYDGERLQVHKFNNQIVCYKRNLNIHYKHSPLVIFLHKALHRVDNVIIDCELMNCKLSDSMYLMVFDIMHCNNVSLMDKSLLERKQILHQAIEPNDRVLLSEYVLCKSNEEIVTGVNYMLSLDIEGVVIKDAEGAYEPKRKKWFKVKKSYYQNVCSADLVVVGGWKSEHDRRIIIYLVACPVYNYETGKWMFLPISKVKIAKHNLEHYMKPYENDDWLLVDDHFRNLNKIPNLIAKDPLVMPVWEIQGDFIRSDNYVSIRLPRFIRVRDDKNFLQATRLFELKVLCEILNNQNLLQDSVLIDCFLGDNIKC
ncbi:ligase [Spodoptera litura granulovirus]|uniref:DNA ligase n=1 Tax=Spodoptera litura granulovirus TaxID=359919 RepID=A5IZW2_9BBAC|nr:ligase [Spodoptera litura granulovirus]ABQ52053.1 ligase [Spodoptera litura granulovirus]